MAFVRTWARNTHTDDIKSYVVCLIRAKSSNALKLLALTIRANSDAFRRIGSSGSVAESNIAQVPGDGCSSDPSLFKSSNSSSEEMSVEVVSSKQWFVIRATHGRGLSVNQELVKLGFKTFVPTEVIPLAKKNPKNSGINYEEIQPFKWLVFVKCTDNEFEDLVKNSRIPGLTPYYNHFRRNNSGRNLYLTVPYQDMESFIQIVRSTNQSVITGLTGGKQPFASGQKVRVIDGEFKGVEGRIKKFLGQKRVVVEMKFIGYAATSYVPKYMLEIIETDKQDSNEE